VQFNGTAASTFILVNSTTISAKVQSGTTSGPISVTTPGGTAISATNFSVSQPPMLNSFTPSSGFIGATVTLNGTNLTNASALQCNGTAATFTVVNATTISATVPAGANSGPMTVTTPDGTATSAVSFTVLLPPTISAFTPSSGALYTVVTITGINLNNTSSVQFNGTASIFIPVNSTTITARIQAGTTSGPISVTTPSGTTSSTTNFMVIPPSPTITSFSPSSGSAWTVVTLIGTNFTWTTAVAFGGTPATAFTIVSATSLTATVRSDANSGKITVTNATAMASSATSFTVKNSPGPNTNPTDNAAMVWVPAGSFTMGSPYGDVSDAGNGSPTTQQVTLAGYWIYKYQVTVAQYRAFCSSTGHALPPWPGSQYSWSDSSDWTAPVLQQMPIVNVTWYDCAAYAAWAGVSLPTAAQYEYAARGPQENNYPWGGVATATDPNNGWDQTKCANSYNSAAINISTWPVGSFPAGVSWCGALDLAGNVWEWCQDWYWDYSLTPVTNPTGPPTGTYRALRGGSWFYSYEYIFRGAARNADVPGYAWIGYGFRCVAASPSP